MDGLGEAARVLGLHGDEPGAAEGELVVRIDDAVATLWLNRPAKRNAVSYAMWRGVAEHCHRLATDRSVRLLVVRGAGGHFCAGADIGGLRGSRGAEGAANGAASAVDAAVVETYGPDDYSAANEAAEEALAGFPKPTIAAISGACVGGGAEIALACDLRIADSSARFGITPARLGIIYPPFALARVVRTIGASAAKHLLYTAEIIDAERALRIGLIDELHEPAAMLGRVAELADTMARRRSLLTQMASKALVDAVSAGLDATIAAVPWQRARAASADPAEGIAAFLERREPVFTWTPEP